VPGQMDRCVSACQLRGQRSVAFMIGSGGMIRHVVVYQAVAGTEVRGGASTYSCRPVER